MKKKEQFNHQISNYDNKYVLIIYTNIWTIKNNYENKYLTDRSYFPET